MNRPPFGMRANKGTEAPSSFLFFDSESYKPVYDSSGNVRRHDLRLWVAIQCRLEGGRVTRRHVHRGKTPAEFWALVDRCTDHYRPLWAFAHNLGHDLTQLEFWPELWARRYTVGPVDRGRDPTTKKKRRPWTGRLCLETRPQFAIVRNKVGVIKFVDSGNYWPTQLAAVGEANGLVKLPMPKWTAPDAEWFHYCERDCAVVEAAVTELVTWWTRERCGVFQLTAPQLALTNWKHTCKLRMRNEDFLAVKFDNKHPALDLERAAYYGGKFQAYFVGKVENEVFELDVNSMYLAVMANNHFPRKRVGEFFDVNPEGLRRMMLGYGAVAQVRINARGNAYTSRHEGQQLHQTGQFWTALAGPELQRALEAGDVDQVGRVQLYVLDDLFGDWARTWFERKAAAKAKGEAGRGEYEFAKLIGVSLYGKFGQHGRYWLDRLDLGWQSEWSQWFDVPPGEEQPVAFRAVAGVAQQQVVGHTPLHGFPAISAYVTAHAREWMRAVIHSLPPQTVYYEGSDSLLCDSTAYRKLRSMGLVDDSKMGSFRLVAKHPGATIKGVNNYKIGKKTVRAGLHGRPRLNARGELVSDRWPTLGEILRVPPDGGIVVVEVPFAETTSLPKGQRTKSGWVKPYWPTGVPGFESPPPLSGSLLRRRPHPVE